MSRLLLACATLVVAAACGIAAAGFLGALDAVTMARTTTPLLIWALPLLGLLLGAAIDRFGVAAAPGMSLVVDGLVEGVALPTRLAPQVVLGTLATHLAGGSAGREGTAVQMGAGIGDVVARALHVHDSPQNRRLLITAGVAGGFAAVFGTPWAGALFALEVPVLRRLQWRWAPAALISAFLGDAVARRLGATHTAFAAPLQLSFSLDVAARWVVVAGVVAATTIAFVVAVREVKRALERHVPRRPLRLALGGVLMLVLWRSWGSDDVLGLGVPSIVAALDGGAVSSWYWLAKFIATVITVGSGFVGGEVTPLFGIGAALGHAMSSHIGLPPTLTAAVCMGALLATATRTPLAIVVMTLELFGASVAPHVVLVVLIAALPARRFGIYGAQRVSGAS